MTVAFVQLAVFLLVSCGLVLRPSIRFSSMTSTLGCIGLIIVGSREVLYLVVYERPA